jgi:hypothetical protein
MPGIMEFIDTLCGEEPKRLALHDAEALAAALDAVGDVRACCGSFAAAGGELRVAARGMRAERYVLTLSKERKEGAIPFGTYWMGVNGWTPAVAAELRAKFPFLRPVPLGPGPSVGLGDRLGIATAGHARAVKGTGVTPAFAQQSIREMTRTKRTPQQVIDGAMWGVLVSGRREAWGADADHLKTTEDVDRCAEAGFVMYTIDPGDHVDDAATDEPPDTLGRKLAEKPDGLPWADLETTLRECRARHVKADVSEEMFARAAAKYGRAIAHAVKMARHIERTLSPRPFEIEVSVDETASPTTPFEHRFVATELTRLGVKIDSLAVRFVGGFEKGVDYRGDLDAFRAEAEEHAQVARELGGYKLSIHSGSDKFCVYPIIAEATRGSAHLKTAGTSYLEALRALAEVDVDLFREIAAVARARYDDDRATYHVSGAAGDVPEPESITAEVARGLLDRDGARQVFHVTYGSALQAACSRGGTVGEQIKDTLAASSKNEEVHMGMLERHLRRHVEPFAAR